MILSTPENNRLAKDFGAKLTALVASVRGASDEVKAAAAVMLFGSGISGLVACGITLAAVLKEAENQYNLVTFLTAEAKAASKAPEKVK